MVDLLVCVCERVWIILYLLLFFSYTHIHIHTPIHSNHSLNNQAIISIKNNRCSVLRIHYTHTHTGENFHHG